MSREREPQRWVFKDINVVNGGEAARRATVIVKGKEIVAVHHVDVSIGPDDQVIDGRELFVTPGFIDSHCHLIYRDVRDPYSIELEKSIAQATIDAVYNARLLLGLGFTTVRDVGSRGNIGAAMRDAIKRGDCAGPNVFAASQIISGPGGLGDMQPSHIFHDSTYLDSLSRLVVGPYEARAAVRKQIKDGADWIKVGASGTGFSPLCPAERDGISELELEAVVDEARIQERPVAVHAESEGSIAKAIRPGVRTIEHGIYLTSQLADAIAKQGIALSPTLGMYAAFAERGLEHGIPEQIVANHRRTHHRHVKSVKLAMERGIPIIAGGDSGLAHFPQGGALEDAIAYVTKCGMSPRDALSTLTANAARVLGIADKVGRIAEGMIADLIVYDANPAQDLTVITEDKRRRAVFQAGRAVARHDLPSLVGAPQ